MTQLAVDMEVARAEVESARAEATAASTRAAMANAMVEDAMAELSTIRSVAEEALANHEKESIRAVEDAVNFEWEARRKAERQSLAAARQMAEHLAAE